MNPEHPTCPLHYSVKCWRRTTPWHWDCGRNIIREFKIANIKATFVVSNIKCFPGYPEW